MIPSEVDQAVRPLPNFLDFGKIPTIIFRNQMPVIDLDGYRANVGIVVCNDQGYLLWARRIGQNAWQFPQGGISIDESPEEAMRRELHEEIGLKDADVEILARTSDWVKYRLPRHMLRRHCKPLCIGQKQIWFLLKLIGDERKMRFDVTDQPEFDGYRWVDYWCPVNEVVSFKRRVYQLVLKEFAPYVPKSAPHAAAPQPTVGKRSHYGRTARR